MTINKENKMKQIIFFFLLFSVYISAQVNGCGFISELDSVGTNYHTCSNGGEFGVFTVTLGSANDTIYIGVGTNLKDSSQAQQEYGDIMVTDTYADESVLVITGNTTTNRKYFIKWGYKQKNFRIKASTNANDTPYVLEVY